MFRNYLVTTLRNLSRNKLYAVINLLGLSVGIACCMLIFLYTKDEVSYDRFHVRKDNIYRITSTITSADGQQNKMGITGMVPGPAFTRQIPELSSFVRLQEDGFAVKKGTEVFQQPAQVVDSNFFSVFTFPLVEGNPKTALNDPYSVVLTEETAQKYFGTKRALGKTLELKTDTTFTPFTVTGIVQKAPQNSSIQFEMLVPMSFRLRQYEDKEWLNFFLNTFVVLSPDASTKRVEEKMAQVFQTDAAVQLKEAAEKYNYQEKVAYGLQPFLDMHLSSYFKAENGLSGASKPLYAYILSGIALFIFLIACINFINLTVARSLKRAKEIGIRKVMGSARRQLVLQFLGESFVLSFFAFVVAIGIAILLLPFFNKATNKELAFSYLFDAKLVTGFVLMFFLTGFLAGMYPSLVLSRFRPVETLYGKLRFGGGNRFAKGLVVLQFALATFLIIATIVLYSQFHFLTHFDLGYNDKNLVVINAGPFKREKLELIRNELLKNPAILAVTADQGGRWGTHAHVNGEEDISFDMKIIDENYLPQLGIPVVRGRNFTTAYATDTSEGVLVNEAFVKTAGWQAPLGETVNFFYNNDQKFRVLGIVKDYHFEALSETVKPLIFLMHPRYQLRDVYVKLRPDKSAEVLPFLQKTFRQLFPFQPYQYQFKDEENKMQYAAEEKWKLIITFGAVLTIVISCIGLFGLSLLAAEKRTKEIGIRKVLGASVVSITRALSFSFLKLVLLASLIAIPAAAWLSQKWLQNYPYRISLSWWMFFSATLLILLLALLTIGYQSVRAARANPVKNLRTE